MAFHIQSIMSLAVRGRALRNTIGVDQYAPRDARISLFGLADSQEVLRSHCLSYGGRRSEDSSGHADLRSRKFAPTYFPGPVRAASVFSTLYLCDALNMWPRGQRRQRRLPHPDQPCQLPPTCLTLPPCAFMFWIINLIAIFNQQR